MDQTSDPLELQLRIPLRISTALPLLLEAVDYAKQTNSDYWEFAVEQEMLFALGLTRNDFRWLVRNELVEHKREVTLESDDGRAFRPSGNLTFPNGTCFILTNKGVLLSRQASSIARANGNVQSSYVESNTRSNLNDIDSTLQHKDSSQHKGDRVTELARPSWEADRRILTLNGTIVKHFKWAAENQESILTVFEEEGWPYRIDDPLKPCPEQDSKRRLSDTIKCLNRKQCNSLVHFRGDGSGEGVVWELVERKGSSCSACE